MVSNYILVDVILPLVVVVLVLRLPQSVLRCYYYCCRRLWWGHKRKRERAVRECFRCPREINEELFTLSDFVFGENDTNANVVAMMVMMLLISVRTKPICWRLRTSWRFLFLLLSYVAPFDSFVEDWLAWRAVSTSLYDQYFRTELMQVPNYSSFLLIRQELPKPVKIR